MTRTTTSTAKTKVQATLDDIHYASENAAKSIESYEKLLHRRMQAARAAGVQALRRHMGGQTGSLSRLFAGLH